MDTPELRLETHFWIRATKDHKLNAQTQLSEAY